MGSNNHINFSKIDIYEKLISPVFDSSDCFFLGKLPPLTIRVNPANMSYSFMGIVSFPFTNASNLSSYHVILLKSTISAGKRMLLILK